ncbi:MAG: helix-turn-helix transcriptional regulator [Deltaproteobacteria bacterium]|nr:helix-turn-helix transcriptional regulator [Deltaproteobacteria bacterium]
MAKPRGPHKNEASRKAFLEQLGGRVADLRQERRLSQRDLAISAGISHDAVSAFELGKRVPTVGTLFDLARALGVDVSALVTFDESHAHDLTPIEALLKGQPSYVREGAANCVSAVVRVAEQSRA